MTCVDSSMELEIDFTYPGREVVSIVGQLEDIVEKSSGVFPECTFGMSVYPLL
jgi:hypothetical protein